MAGITGETSITLKSGRKLRFVYDYDAMIALEEASGMKMLAVRAEMKRLEESGEEPSMRFSRAILFGGLQRHHGNEISLQQVGDMMLEEPASFGGAFAAMNGRPASVEDEGSRAVDADADPPKKAAGIGAAS